ncbi:MAG: glycosyl transferase, partial [bacterium]
MLADGRGFLFPFGDDIALGKILDRLLGDTDLLNRTKKAAYDFSRKMVWSEVANEYMALFEKALHVDKHLVEIGASERPSLKPPDLRLDHLVRLTDDTGILEHAKHVVPDRDHGYCLDDNTRALIVTSWAYHITHEVSTRELAAKYLGFVKHAQREDGLFHSRLSYQREFMDDVSPDNSIGRAIWALGHVVWRPTLRGHRAVANECFDKTFTHIPKLNLRGSAFAAMGLSAYLKHFQNHELARRTLRETCARIVDHYDNCADGEWNWFEEILVYDNAIMPCALFHGYRETKEESFLSTALSSLAFLEKVCFSSGNLRIVGNDGWYPKGGKMAAFDQQPVDAADFVLAYREAYHCTGENKFLSRMKRSFNWFLGRNDLGMPLYDFETAGCADGLTSSNISFNQGAESTVSFLMALLAMMEISTSPHKLEG